MPQAEYRGKTIVYQGASRVRSFNHPAKLRVAYAGRGVLVSGSAWATEDA